MKISNFQLKDHRLINVEYNLNRNFSNPKGTISLDISSEIVVNRISKNEATVQFTLFVFKDQKMEEVPFKIKTVHEGNFIWDDSYEEDFTQKLLHYNAPAILLSYDRSIISQMTAYSGLPPLLIPLIDFTASKTSPEGDPVNKQND
ncbi:MAG: protein-export chaperone SecB [Spirochaetales bacterium]|nr:protein-export chaperone SecB [Spirochaetales bacterium]